MKRMTKILVFVLIAIVALVFFWPRQPEPAPVYETQEQAGGEVTVSVTPVTLEPKQKPQFQISFETHSVDLDFDVSEIALLVDDQGNTYGLATWNGSPPGGHHRQGTLTFENPLPVIVESVVLSLNTVAGVPDRSFQWTIL